MNYMILAYVLSNRKIIVFVWLVVCFVFSFDVEKQFGLNIQWEAWGLHVSSFIQNNAFLSVNLSSSLVKISARSRRDLGYLAEIGEISAR